jgi:hypothetical protein
VTLVCVTVRGARGAADEARPRVHKKKIVCMRIKDTILLSFLYELILAGEGFVSRMVLV